MIGRIRVRLDTNRSQVSDAVLRGLRLELAGRADPRHEREMYVGRVVLADVLAELADRLEERQTLDVADRPANLDEHDVYVFADALNAVFDLVGDVRDDLDGAAKILAPAFLLDDGLIDLPGRPVVVARGGEVREPLIVAQIEIGLRAIVGDIDLAVLKRAHRARVDVDVGIEFLQRDLVPMALEQTADRRSRQALAERRHHTTRHENVFHRPRVPRVHQHHLSRVPLLRRWLSASAPFQLRRARARARGQPACLPLSCLPSSRRL